MRIFVVRYLDKKDFVIKLHKRAYSSWEKAKEFCNSNATKYKTDMSPNKIESLDLEPTTDQISKSEMFQFFFNMGLKLGLPSLTTEQEVMVKLNEIVNSYNEIKRRFQ